MTLRRALAVASAWLGCIGAALAQTPYFRQPAANAPPALAAQALTPQEHAFIAALPEVRVGIAQPPSRPYEEIGPDGQVSGIHPEMLVHLARTFGLKLRPVLLPDWTSMLRAVRDRQVDLVMTLGVTAERQEYLEFTLGTTPLPGALFSRTEPGAAASAPASSPAAISAPPDLSRARFVLERDFLANDFVRRQYPQASILTVGTTGEALAAVGDGRADYYLGSLLEAVDWLARQPVSNVRIDRLFPYGSGFYHFGVRKDWAPLAGILNKGLSSMRASPLPGWDQALARLPPDLALPRPVALNPAESALLAGHPVWRIGAVQGLPMLNDVDARGVHSGIASEYVQQMTARLGVHAQVVPFPDVGAMLDALRAGSIDLVPFLTRTPERSREFLFSHPYVEMPYMIVARTDAPLYWDLGSLRGKRLALARAHPLREVLAQRYPEIEIVTTANGNLAMDAVAEGRADAAVEVKLFANLRIHSDHEGRLRTVAALADLPAQFHFAAARGAQALIPLVDHVLADIPDTERERMLRRWVAVDLQPAFPWRRYLPVAAVVLAALLALAGATAWWRRRLAREAEQRRLADDRLRDIGDTLPCVAFRYLVDASHELRGTYFSSGARELLGIDLNPQATLLTTLAPRLRPEHLDAAQEAQNRSMVTGERFKFTAAYAHPDGRERWLHAEAVVTQVAGGLRAWTGYVVDVSSERDLLDRLMRESEQKNLMLASASHELRAPTHTLSLALQSISAEGLQKEQRTALRVAKDAAQTLQQLLNDVLDAARFDTDLLRLRPQNFDLRDLVGQLSDAFRASAASKGLQFDSMVALEVPGTVYLDPLRLKQVLINLLSNAVKYTAQGHVELHVDREIDEAGGVVLRFAVTDTGAGIADDELQHLFTPFATGGSAPAALPEGSSGLGLAISRRLATLMGGTVDLRSSPGAGTCATLRVPLRGVAHAGPLSEGHGAVLLCDDDDISRLLLTHLLTQHGFDVVEVRDAPTALQRWRAGGVRALITDLDMSGMGGAQLIRSVRAEERDGARTRVLVCSGHAASSLDPQVHELIDAYLVKPVGIQALLEALEPQHQASVLA